MTRRALACREIRKRRELSASMHPIAAVTFAPKIQIYSSKWFGCKFSSCVLAISAKKNLPRSGIDDSCTRTGAEQGRSSEKKVPLPECSFHNCEKLQNFGSTSCWEHLWCILAGLPAASPWRLDTPPCDREHFT